MINRIEATNMSSSSSSSSLPPLQHEADANQSPTKKLARDSPLREVGVGATKRSRGSGDHTSNRRSATLTTVSVAKPAGGGVGDDISVNNHDAEEADAEWAKLRCGSLTTEELVRQQQEREARRNRQNRCADYPGLAFGSAMFGSDTTMKFNIIKNELHNIMRSQLKRVDGEVNALATRVKDFDRRLEVSAELIRGATVALAEAVAVQIEESKNSTEAAESEESSLSAFDQHVLFLEGQLKEARLKASISFQILEDCHRAQAALLQPPSSSSLSSSSISSSSSLSASSTLSPISSVSCEIASPSTPLSSNNCSNRNSKTAEADAAVVALENMANNNHHLVVETTATTTTGNNSSNHQMIKCQQDYLNANNLSAALS